MKGEGEVTRKARVLKMMLALLRILTHLEHLFNVVITLTLAEGDKYAQTNTSLSDKQLVNYTTFVGRFQLCKL
jgi:hypothetical protein